MLGLLVLQSTSSFVLDNYQQLLKDHIVVTLFLTMLVGAGGNAGNQSSIKVIRGLVGPNCSPVASICGLCGCPITFRECCIWLQTACMRPCMLFLIAKFGGGYVEASFGWRTSPLEMSFAQGKLLHSSMHGCQLASDDYHYHLISPFIHPCRTP